MRGRGGIRTGRPIEDHAEDDVEIGQEQFTDTDARARWLIVWASLRSRALIASRHATAKTLDLRGKPNKLRARVSQARMGRGCARQTDRNVDEDPLCIAKNRRHRFDR
jgi:hypothetical protein